MKIIGSALPRMPWQDRPAGSSDPVWRFSANPIIGVNPAPGIRNVYNSAVVPWGDAFIGVFRCDYHNQMPYLHVGRSPDGLRWTLAPERIAFRSCPGVNGPMEYAYDPRVTPIDGEYVITWCNGYHGPTIGVARTRDFETFEQLDNAFLPFNRNGVLFPRKIDGHYAMLNRPSDPGHTPFGEIFFSQSPDLHFWGKHRHVLGPRKSLWWESVKVGAGPVPIETDAGWLMIYHGVISTCNGFIYSMGAALLDAKQPWRVLARTDTPLLGPEAPYETIGKVANVVFPCAALTDAPSGRIAIYYGAADSVSALCFCTIDSIAARLS